MKKHAISVLLFYKKKTKLINSFMLYGEIIQNIGYFLIFIVLTLTIFVEENHCMEKLVKFVAKS